MMINFLRNVNQDQIANEVLTEDELVDEQLLAQCLKANPENALHLFNVLYQKYLQNRTIASLVLYYLGLLYEKRREPNTALRYFNHLVLNYQDQPGLQARALAKIQSFKQGS